MRFKIILELEENQIKINDDCTVEKCNAREWLEQELNWFYADDLSVISIQEETQPTI